MIQTLLPNNSYDFVESMEFTVETEKRFMKKEVTHFFIDCKGVIREIDSLCPCCKSSMVVLNGYTSYDNKVTQALKIDLSKGQ